MHDEPGPAQCVHRYRVVLVPIGALFTVRVVCEQTLLPWLRGASRFGFSILHSYVDIAGVLIMLMNVVWALAVLVRRARHRSGISRSEWALIAIVFSCGVAWSMTNEQWMLLTVRAHGGGNVPNSWIVSAASTGQLRLLNYLLSIGIGVDTRGRFGESALGAAVANHTEVVELLLDRGADRWARDVMDRTALDWAQYNHNARMVGALRLRRRSATVPPE